MHTHFISEEQIDGYLADLSVRLLEGERKPPLILCPIGNSGDVLVHRLLRKTPELADRVSVFPLDYNRETNEPDFGDKYEEFASDLQGTRILVIDSSVHSGWTMGRIIESLNSFNPSEISSYTIVLKRSARLIPSFWALTIDDHDRAYFLLERLPNNRLGTKTPAVHIRKLTHDVANRQQFIPGIPAFDRVTWNDRLKLMDASNNLRYTYYLEERANLLGFVTFTRIETDAISAIRINELVVDPKIELAVAEDYAHALVRWAETNARQWNCKDLRAWLPIEDSNIWEGWGFVGVLRARETPRGPLHRLMVKRVLYHI